MLTLKRTTKRAAIGGTPDANVENTFSQLAWTYLNDKAPRLGKYVIGFQLIDRSSDGEREAGVFGCKVGQTWVFAPSFFLEGQIKGHELLWLAKPNEFVPCKEEWVDQLLADQPDAIGEASPKSPYEMGALAPNFRQVVNYPWPKFAADGKPFAAWSRPFLEMVAGVHVKKAADDLKKLPDIDLGRLLVKYGALTSAVQAYHIYPAIKRGFDQFHGEDFLPKLVEQNRPSVLQVKRAAFAQAAKLNPILPLKLNKGDAKQEQKKQGSVRILVRKIASTMSELELDRPTKDRIEAGLEQVEDARSVEDNPETRSKLVLDGIVVEDSRGDDETTRVFDADTRMQLTNPTSPGVYKLFDRIGGFDEVIVTQEVRGPSGLEKRCLVVRPKPKAWKVEYSTNLVVKGDIEDVKSSWKKWFADLPSTKPTEGKRYAAVSPSGEATCPFYLYADHGDGMYEVSWSYGSERAYKPPQHAEGPNSYDNDRWLSLRAHRGAAGRSQLGEVIFPQDSKFVELRDHTDGEKEPDRYEGTSGVDSGETPKTGRAILPGTMSDLEAFLRKNTSDLGLATNYAGGVQISDQKGTKSSMSKTAAVVALVLGYGLREKAAREIVNRAALSGTGVVQRYKLAYSPLWTDSVFQADAGSRTPHRVQEFQEEQVPIDRFGVGASSPIPVHEPYPDQQLLDVASQASQAGHKNLFDVAVLSALLRPVTQEQLIDADLPKLRAYTSMLGQKLFRYYWHKAIYEERYGQRDLPEIEDMLRNAFEVSGDLELKLMQKSESPQSQHDPDADMLESSQD